MHFYEQLNQYMKVVNCTAKELCTVSGISAAALSRYRSGERVPDVHSETFEQLCSALETLALKREAQISQKQRSVSNFSPVQT